MVIMTNHKLFLTKTHMGVKIAKFDGDFIFLEVVQNGFCILAIQSFSAYNFSGNIFCKRRTIFKQFAKIKNLFLHLSVSV
jgi:hypothetical protein